MIKQMVVCDRCQRPIEGKDSGLVVMGNIHVIKHDEPCYIGGGLVGNNFTDGWQDEIKDGEPVTVGNHSHYHVECLTSLLGQVKKPLTRDLDGLSQLDEKRGLS